MLVTAFVVFALLYFLARQFPLVQPQTIINFVGIVVFAIMLVLILVGYPLPFGGRV